MKHKQTILIAILLAAAVLRLWNLPAADVITDEGLNGFRSIGYIDFFVSEYQTTPYDWLGAAELPGWTKMSFHDHPPLTFIIQNIFFKIGGVNLWNLRLPFALAGIASVYLVYLITKQLFKDSEQNEILGLVAAFLLAINSYHVWISRIGLQESILISLMLLASYLFLRSLENKKYLTWTGLALGLALLSKYTAIVLAPIFIIYLFIYKRKYFREKTLYLSSLISLAIFSPVLLYNLKLYQKFGHFDFQFSYFFNQQVDAWQFRLGRLQAGSFGDKIIDLFPAIARGSTPILAGLAIVAAICLLLLIYKKSVKAKAQVFLSLAIIFHLLLFIGIGPRERFVAMIIPFLVIAVAWMLVIVVKPLFINRAKLRLIYAAILLFLAAIAGYELFYSINTSLKSDSLSGREGIEYSRLKFESLNWGYNELDIYLTKELYQDYYPAFNFPTRFVFLEDIKQAALDKAKAQGKQEKNILIIYDENMHSSATIWYIFRPFVYQAWPLVSAESYNQVTATEGQEFFRNQGIEEFMLIKATENTLLRTSDELKTSADDLAASLDVLPEIISNPRVGEAFEIYKF